MARIITTWYLSDVLSTPAQTLLTEAIRLTIPDDMYSELTVERRFVSLVVDSPPKGLFDRVEKFLGAERILQVSRVELPAVPQIQIAY